MPIERMLHGLWSNGALDSFAAAAATYGLYACVAICAVAFLRAKPRGAIVPFIVGAVAAVALDVLAGLVYQEQRPFVVLGVTPLVAHDTDNGFPSDHSAAAAFISTVALFVDPPLGAIAWVFTALLGAGRLFCLLHTPLDIAAGWVIGTAPAVLAGVYRKRRLR
jgi:undecaprenyl-diphosphatase